jgi:hypothetical protein
MPTPSRSVVGALLAALVLVPVAAADVRAGERIEGVPPVLPDAPAPYQPGDKVWTSPVPLALGPDDLESTGCQRVPPTGYLGSGVYAESSRQYSTHWSWSNASAYQPFSWYVITSGGTIKAHGTSGGFGDSRTVTANIHYWKVQNNGSTPQAWNVCWND